MTDTLTHAMVDSLRNSAHDGNEIEIVDACDILLEQGEGHVTHSAESQAEARATVLGRLNSPDPTLEDEDGIDGPWLRRMSE